MGMKSVIVKSGSRLEMLLGEGSERRSVGAKDDERGVLMVDTLGNQRYKFRR